MGVRLHDTTARTGDRFDRLGAWVTAGLFWLGVAIAAVVLVFCGLLALINTIY